MHLRFLLVDRHLGGSDLLVKYTDVWLRNKSKFSLSSSMLVQFGLFTLFSSFGRYSNKLRLVPAEPHLAKKKKSFDIKTSTGRTATDVKEQLRLSCKCTDARMSAVSPVADHSMEKPSGKIISSSNPKS